MNVAIPSHRRLHGGMILAIIMGCYLILVADIFIVNTVMVKICGGCVMSLPSTGGSWGRAPLSGPFGACFWWVRMRAKNFYAACLAAARSLSRRQLFESSHHPMSYNIAANVHATWQEFRAKPVHVHITWLRCALIVLCVILGKPALAQVAGPAFTNSIGMVFVQIPAGTFQMGSDPTDREASADEKPKHQVTISKPFSLGQHEVTQAQWEAVMGSSPFTLDRSNPYYSLPGMAARLTKPNHPATVSWNDAQAFIARLNQKEGHTHYRLPTEAEWEYAARAGTATAYSFGDKASQLGRHAWFGEDFASGSTHPVGQKMPNRWGLYDVHGNVWEWVQDWYADHYEGGSVALDPSGPASGSRRVVRGGSWHESSGSWRSAVRKPYAPDYRGISIGLRVAMSGEAAR